MVRTVEIPLWLLVLILGFAAVTFASHFLFPSVRWFFRRRAERLVARLNARLARPIEPFKLARRHDMIQRLSYDAEVIAAAQEEAARAGIPDEVAFERARRYAREIVPSFSATAYFKIGIRLARWLSRSTYRVRLGAFDRKALAAIDPDATVIFVMNHRSNMDYVLVTYLVSRAGALSYAVGEWARVWPLSALIKMMGAYFIRRKSRGQLYRKVLARYVQMATQNGVTQAVFPEGGLSLDGRLAPPRLGLLNYIVEGGGARDVIFVPVAINYDRVLEDRILLAAGQAGRRKFSTPFRRTAWALMRHLWLRLTRRFRDFGKASVSFGAPLSLEMFRAGRDGDVTEELGEELMARIAAVMPVLPVPVVAGELLRAGRVLALAELEQAVRRVVAGLRAADAHLPQKDPARILRQGLDILAARKLVVIEGGEVRTTAAAEPVLAFYANSIAHLADAPPRGIAGSGEQ